MNEITIEQLNKKSLEVYGKSYIDLCSARKRIIYSYFK
jgi:hypothetical protein